MNNRTKKKLIRVKLVQEKYYILSVKDKKIKSGWLKTVPKN